MATEDREIWNPGPDDTVRLEHLPASFLVECGRLPLVRQVKELAERFPQLNERNRTVLVMELQHRDKGRREGRKIYNAAMRAKEFSPDEVAAMRRGDV